MSLDRKDIRAKLDPDVHEALVAICDRDGVDIGEYVEREIEKIVMSEMHKFILSRSKFDSLGIVRKGVAKSGRGGE